MEVLTFYLEEEPYGIDVRNIVEIVEQLEPVRVPLSPPYVEGIANLRGEIVPIVNLKKRFGAKKSGGQSIVVIILHKGEKLGIMIDRISGIQNVQETELKKPTRRLKKLIPPEFLTGVFSIGKTRYLLLDIDKILEEKGG
ncbi:chemotaxis protein CheW [candidate division WOR-3 bacterium]|nr:chemotaxis protein CheW [candidate division WOR-3 bacterium]